MSRKSVFLAIVFILIYLLTSGLAFKISSENNFAEGVLFGFSTLILVLLIRIIKK